MVVYGQVATRRSKITTPILEWENFLLHSFLPSDGSSLAGRRCLLFWLHGFQEHPLLHWPLPLARCMVAPLRAWLVRKAWLVKKQNQVFFFFLATAKVSCHQSYQQSQQKESYLFIRDLHESQSKHSMNPPLPSHTLPWSLERVLPTQHHFNTTDSRLLAV